MLQVTMLFDVLYPTDYKHMDENKFHVRNNLCEAGAMWCHVKRMSASQNTAPSQDRSSEASVSSCVKGIIITVTWNLCNNRGDPQVGDLV